MFSQEHLDKTDYLTETLRTEKQAQIEIFEQMIKVLERHGECRAVYHRLAYVLLGTDIGPSLWIVDRCLGELDS